MSSSVIAQQGSENASPIYDTSEQSIQHSFAGQNFKQVTEIDRILVVLAVPKFGAEYSEVEPGLLAHRPGAFVFQCRAFGR